MKDHKPTPDTKYGITSIDFFTGLELLGLKEC